jgi:serine/threonine protein kinase/Tol biopolymer transport system component
MEPERWQHIDQLFHLALGLQPDRRAVFLAEACSGDEALRREVEDLISSHEQAKDFIESPASDLAAEFLANDQAGLKFGDRLGPYEIQSVLGIGGMGEVYLASDSRLGRQVALKILPPRFTLDPERVSRFENEARAASALNHPNIVTIYEIGQFENARFIITEFVDGQTLRQLMNERPLTLNETLNVTIQVAMALTSAHTAGIVHRDIKPENIMLRADGYVKILDFGLAKLTETTTSGSDPETPTLLQSNPGLLMGTVQYMSPEQARRKHVDLRTDVWSLGIVLYELLAGRVPFQGETPSHVMVSLMDDELLPLTTYAQVPIELNRIVVKALRKNKKYRYQTARQFAHDLKELKRELQLQGQLKQPLETNDHLIARRTKIGKQLPVTDTSASNRSAGIRFEPGFKRSTKAIETVANSAKVLSTSPLRKKAGYSYLIAAVIVVVVLVAGVAFLRSWFTRSRQRGRETTAFLASFSSEDLLTNGKIVHAIISPDGKNVIYTNGMSGKQSVWLRQLESDNNIEIIPPADDIYGGLAYSPDGNSFYFTRRPRNAATGLNVYRVSILGGVPIRIVSEVQGALGISPDGRNISFVRCPGSEPCSLWIAGTDGSNERKLYSSPRSLAIEVNKISPDGKSIAFAVGRSTNAADEFGLGEVNIDSGAERELTTQKFRNITSLAWLPNQNDLVIAASRIPNHNYSRLWRISVATGDAIPLTRDSENYTALSLDATGSLIIARQTRADFSLLLYNRENPSDKRMVVNAKEGDFAPNGKILFSSQMSGNGEIWSINSDGSEQRQLTNDAADDGAPISSPDSKSIFFASNRTGQVQIWRMNADGSNQTQITVKDGGYPIFVSPDGRWVYYHHGLHRTLWRVSAKGDEESQLVLNKQKTRFAVSRDGLWVAFPEKQGEERLLVVASLLDGRTSKTIKCADQQAGVTQVEWLPDGRSLAYIQVNNESHTMWLQSLDEDAPRKNADLGPEEISSFAVSPDGDTFALVQGSWKHNAVLLRDLR